LFKKLSIILARCVDIPLNGGGGYMKSIPKYWFPFQTNLQNFGATH
jgi:hypothetical protein